MKSFFFFAVLLTSILFSSCGSHPKFVSKTDTVIATFKPKKGLYGPVQNIVGAYTTYEKKVYSDSPTLSESTTIGYKWRVKVSDTTPDGHGHSLLDSITHRPIPLWQDVNDSLVKFLTIDTTGN